MPENTREKLNQLYRPLDKKVRELMVKLTGLHGGYKVVVGFYNGHYHKNAAGECEEDAYPIPVISVKGLCDVEIDFDGICITTKLSKDQLLGFDWSAFSRVPFEVYGVEDYLNDYGNAQTADTIREHVLPSKEKEFFVSFSFPTETSGEGVLEFLRTLQKNHFYY